MLVILLDFCGFLLANKVSVVWGKGGRQELVQYVDFYCALGIVTVSWVVGNRIRYHPVLVDHPFISQTSPNFEMITHY